MINRRQRFKEWRKNTIWHYFKYEMKGHLFFTYTLVLTIVAGYLFYDKIEVDDAIEDWLIVSNACKDKVIEARAEAVFYGDVKKLVFYCK